MFKTDMSTPEAMAYELGGIEFRPFQKYIANKIMNGLTKGGARFIISVPPAHGKSELCSRWIPLWRMNGNPSRKICIASYNIDNSEKWGRILRNTIEDNKSALKVSIARDSTAKRRWDTTAGGYVKCAGIKGTLTGNHFTDIIIDDPLKDWIEASSQAKREAVIDWYNTVVSTRLLPNANVLLIMTRWHENDLAGYLLREATEKWTYIRLPAISEGEGDLLKRKKGEYLCPDLYGEKFFNEQKKRLGSMQFAALYQQTPLADGGNVFKREYWQRYTPAAKPKKFTRIIHSWDTAFETKKSNAYSVCTTWGEYENRFYLLNIWREKADYPTVKRKMFDLWKSEKSSVILLEDKATGKPLRQELRKAGLPIIEVEPIADKLTRAHSVTPLFEDKRVFIADGESWADDLIDGCAAYPAGDWSDGVDTISQGLTWLSQTGGALDEESLKNIQVGQRKALFRFGASMNGFTVRERSHWYLSNVGRR